MEIDTSAATTASSATGNRAGLAGTTTTTTTTATSAPASTRSKPLQSALKSTNQGQSSNINTYPEKQAGTSSTTLSTPASRKTVHIESTPISEDPTSNSAPHPTPTPTIDLSSSPIQSTSTNLNPRSSGSRSSSSVHPKLTPGVSIMNKSDLKPPGPTVDGLLTRELYALIGDNAPSLAQAKAELGASRGVGGSGVRFGLGSGGRGVGRRWRQTPFNPAHRDSPIKLSHWKPLPLDQASQNGQGQDGRVVDGQVDDPFEAFGRPGLGPNVMSYSQVEYDAWLTDEKWTPHETNYLFSLLKAYDLRFLVVTDRYAYIAPGGKTGQDEFTGDYAWPMVPPGLARKKKKLGGSIGTTGSGGAAGSGETVRRSSRMGQGQNSRGATPLPSTSGSASVPATVTSVAQPPMETEVKTRSMEEIKDRYYTVCRRLLRNRPAVDEAFKERMVKAYDYDLHREVARKKYANSLFHLTRPQMLEEESLYVELKRMEQTERRYRSDREELMRVMGGLDSGILVPPSGEQGNRAFGRGEVLGIGQARGPDGTVLADKLKKRRRGEDGEPAGDVEMPPPPPPKKKVDPMFDERNNITHIPPQPGQLTTSRNTHQPAYLRGTRLPALKPDIKNKTHALLAEMHISTVSLVMPTKDNISALEKTIHAAEGLIEMKRLVDRVEVEVRTLKAQRDGIAMTTPAAVPVSTTPIAEAVEPDVVAREVSAPPKSQRNAQRSASVVSSTASEMRKKK